MKKSERLRRDALCFVPLKGEWYLRGAIIEGIPISAETKPYECQSCGECWTSEELKPIPERGIFDRVAPGEPMPAGECPECGAVCHASEATARAGLPEGVILSLNEKAGMRWLLSAPISWDEKVTESGKAGTSEIQEIANWLDQVAVRAVRLSGYLEARGATGCGDGGHASGVKSSNKKAAKVRKAIGYTQPKNDINF